MRVFKSFLAPEIRQFIRYRSACSCWNQSYESNLSSFDRYCFENHSTKVVLEQDIIDSWCIQRSSETNNSCRARIAPVVAFVKYLYEKNITSVKEPLIPKRTKCTHIPHSFSDLELSTFFSACDNISLGLHPNLLVRSQKLTIPVFFRLIYSSGMRICEVRKLKKKDIDFEQGVVNIRHSKGNDQHYIVLHDSMMELMKHYDQAIEKLYPNRMYFFPGRNGSCHGSSWVDENFKKIWDNVNISNAIPYDLRHNYAIRNINRWNCSSFEFESKLLYLSKSMGHRTLESTKYYYSITPAMSQIIVEKSGFTSDWLIPEVEDEENR